MKFKITCVTPMGTFESREAEGNENDIEDLKIFGQRIAKSEYLSLENDGKIVYIPNELLQKSIFIVEVKNENS